MARPEPRLQRRPAGAEWSPRRTLGLVLATPILATLIVLIRLIYIEDILGDKAPEPEKTQPATISSKP